jgi:hypothetical protein
MMAPPLTGLTSSRVPCCQIVVPDVGFVTFFPYTTCNQILRKEENSNISISLNSSPISSTTIQLHGKDYLLLPPIFLFGGLAQCDP